MFRIRGQAAQVGTIENGRNSETSKHVCWNMRSIATFTNRLLFHLHLFTFDLIVEGGIM